MDRQYPNNPDRFAGVSEHSFNISDLSFVVILNDEVMPMTVGFWNYIPLHGCGIEWHYCDVPKGRNYVCLCNIHEENWNRMFLRTYNYAYTIKATMELTREGRTGLLLHIIPTANDKEESDVSTRIPTLQFLCAGKLSLQESDQIRHISSEDFKNNTYQNAKNFDMLPAEGWMGHACICGNVSMRFNYP